MVIFALFPRSGRDFFGVFMDKNNTKPSTPKAVEDCRALLLWMIPQLDKLPRVRRYTLGEKLENRLLMVLESW